MSIGEVWSPRGNPVSVHVREGTTDAMVATATFSLVPGVVTDEYRLARYRISGWALDVGAHIGVVTLALLADNPDLLVVAIEPLPENVEMIRKNLALNGWTDRCEIRWGAVGTTEVDWDYPGEEGSFARINRYIGHLSDLTPTAGRVAKVPRIDLSFLPRMAFAKWDCEGCEWPSIREVQADHIVGEWHGEPGIEGLRDLLEGYRIEATDPGPIGSFWAEREIQDGSGTEESPEAVTPSDLR